MTWQKTGPDEWQLKSTNFAIILTKYTQSEFYAHLESTSDEINYVRRMFITANDLAMAQDFALSLLRRDLAAMKDVINQDLTTLTGDENDA